MRLECESALTLAAQLVRSPLKLLKIIHVRRSYFRCYVCSQILIVEVFRTFVLDHFAINLVEGGVFVCLSW